MNVLLIAFVLITLVNILAYLWAYSNQSDHLTDISYSACFIFVALYFLYAFGSLSTGRVMLTLMIVLWGLRLGGFLFYRINTMGKDERFDSFRSSRTGFLKFWLLQSISIWIISLPLMLGLTKVDLGFSTIFFLIWLIGFVIESVADYQKFSFRQHTSDKLQFIATGLYKHIRHPNYLGEILCWIGVFGYVSASLVGSEWLSIISPMWVIILLVSISGIPLIEVANSTKYRNNVAFDTYTKQSWRLLPYIY